MRFITDNNVMSILGEAGEVLAFKAIADANIGPKLFGVADRVRLEEYIDGRFFTVEESKDVQVLTAIARSLARLHSLEVPIARDPNVYLNSIRTFVRNGQQTIRSSSTFKDLSQFDEKSQKCLRKLLPIDFLGHFDWIMATHAKIKSRVICLSHGDHYVNNILIRNQLLGDAISEWDVINIDVEMGSCFYRGLDVGLFLHELNFSFRDNTSAPEVVGPIDEQLQRHFIEQYLKTWIELNPDKYDPELDTFDNVLIESRVLGLFSSVYVPTYFLVRIANDPQLIDYNFINFLVKRWAIDQDRVEWINETVNHV